MDITRNAGRFTASVLIYLLTVNPVLAAGIALDNQFNDNASLSQTSLSQASNGVPIVAIATANGQGLSHNRFSEYNVTSSGIILNNLATGSATSQLGGVLDANGNLNGISASLILNEVTGTNPSLLQGYTEVFGTQADVVVANPYGITCNGCGFINTPRATLTTGTPIIENGVLTQLDVNGGSVAIEGLGLNASNIDQFDIITRALTLNAELNAKELSIITGRNTVDYQDLSGTVKASDGTTAPVFALDASALGSMYANSIHLIGTETGVGVRSLGDIATRSGDLSLNVNGNLSLNTASAQNITLSSSQDIALNGDVYALNQLSVSAQDTITVNETVAAGTSAVLTARNLAQQGNLLAGIESDGTRNNSGELSVTTQSLVNTGTMLATDQLLINTNTLDNRNASLLSNNALTITADTLDNSGGLIDATSDVHISTTGLLTNRDSANNTGVLNSSTGNITLTVDSLVNSGQIQAGVGALAITTTGVVDNQQGTLISQSTSLNASELNNTGGRIVGDTVILNSQSTINDQGQVLAGLGGVSISGSDVNNQNGLIESASFFTLNLTGLFDNNGKGSRIRSLGTGNILSSITAAKINNANNGLIETNNSQLTLDTSSGSDREDLLNDNGTIRHTGNGIVTVKATHWNNGHGSVISDGNLKVTADTVTNISGFISSGLSHYQITNSLDNTQGRLESGLLNITAGSLLNHGGYVVQFGDSDQTISIADVFDNGDRRSPPGHLLTAANNVSVSASLLLNSGQINHTGSGALTLGARSVENQGTIGSDGSIHFNRGRYFSDLTGVVQASETLSFTGEGVDNFGGSLSAKNVTANIERGSFYNTGKLEALDSFTINVSDYIGDDGSLRSLSETGDSQLTARSFLSLSNGSLSTNNENLFITAPELNARQGQITHAGNGTLQFNVMNLSGDLDVGTNGFLAADVISNWNLTGGDISADTLRFKGSDSITSLASIEANHLDINLGGDLNVESGVLTQRGTDPQIIAAKNIINTGAISSNASTLTFQADSITNDGRVLHYGLEGLLAHVSGTFVNSFEWISNAKASITADEIRNTRDITSQNMTLNVRLLDNEYGRIHSFGDHLNINVQQNFINRQGIIWSENGAILSADQLHNANGRIEAKNTIDFTLNEFVQNYGAVLNAGESITVNSDGNLKIDGSFRAQGDWRFNIGGTFFNSAYLATQGDITINAGSLFSEIETSIAAGNDLVLNVTSDIADDGYVYLTAKNDLFVTAARIFNTESVFAAGRDAVFNLSGNSTNNGLIFAGRNLSVFSQGRFLNLRGDVFASQDFVYALDNTLAKGGVLENRSGTIEAFGGDFSAYADNVMNTKDVFEHQVFETTAPIQQTCSDCSGDNYSGNLIISSYISDVITQDSPAAQMLAAGNLVIETGDGNIENAYSQILAGGDITLTGTRLTNTGFSSGEKVVTESRSGRMTDGTYERTYDNHVKPYNKNKVECTWCQSDGNETVYRVHGGTIPAALYAAPWSEDSRIETYIPLVESPGL
ncbi:filamentous hemagglutinin N-terminal domain-containing protein, partial [Parendozoicomonas sp. Alg238-R29]|uniref:filamentous hemagglutinin N-terminal domain-containing protein n=1 Tax=Parendozoicomonas sp. Alg238-R29 TaxID=2993446 RepID=UPI00248E526D